MRYLLILLLLVGCQATRPQSEGWQDAPTKADLRNVRINVRVYVFPILSDDVKILVEVRILDQGGDIGAGGKTGDQDVDAEQKTDVDVDADVDVTPIP